MKAFFLAVRKVVLKGVKQQVWREITAALSSSAAVGNSSPSHVYITCTSMIHSPSYIVG